MNNTKALTDVDISASVDNIFVNDSGKVRQVSKATLFKTLESAEDYQALKSEVNTLQESVNGIDTTTDTTLTKTGKAADAKATGDAIKKAKEDMAKIDITTDKTLTQSDKPADSAVVGQQIGSLKESLVDVTTSKTGKNLFKLTDGRESFETYFNVEFENGLITVSKGAKDYNNYLKLNTKRTVTLEKGTYTFSIQNVSDDVNMGYIRLRDGNTEIAGLSLFGSNLGTTSKTFILNNTSELTLEIEVNCAKLSDTPKSVSYTHLTLPTIA